jgi:hypothetical protein
MSKFTIKKLPPIKLTDLLRKRKTNLKDFLASTGIISYVTLSQKCDKMGVSPPPEEDFQSAAGAPVSSPQEGIVVLDPPALLKDTGKKIQVDVKVDPPAVAEPQPIIAEDVKSDVDTTESINIPTQKSSKKKKELASNGP